MKRLMGSAGSDSLPVERPDRSRRFRFGAPDGANVPKRRGTSGRHLWAIIFDADRPGEPAPEPVRTSLPVALRRTVAVVSTRDRDRWGKTLGALLPGNIVVQPHDRGTAAAILRPLLSIARRDSCANVILVPSRQLNSHVTLLRRDLATAVDFLDTREKSILLLGVVPVGSHPGRDWILPEGPDAAVQHVRALLDAPGLFRAAELRARGALINSLVVAARARDLVDAYIKTLPDLVFRFLPFAQPTGLGTDTVLQEFYRDLPALDFYRDVLGRCAAELFVLRVADRLPRAPKLSA